MKTLTKTLAMAEEVMDKAKASQPLTPEANVAVWMVRTLLSEYDEPSRFGGQFKSSRLRYWTKRAEREIGGAA